MQFYSSVKFDWIYWKGFWIEFRENKSSIVLNYKTKVLNELKCKDIKNKINCTNLLKKKNIFFQKNTIKIGENFNLRKFNEFAKSK
jgi:hypothetical protein